MRHKRRAKTRIQDLPRELVFDILSRLPVRTVYNCSCVCKDWFSCIVHRDFATLHHSHIIPNTHDILVVHVRNTCFNSDSGSNIFYLVDYDEDLTHTTFRNPVDICVDSSTSDIRIMGSANGLICLRSREKDGDFCCYDSFHICNPITRELFNVPEFPSFYNHCRDSERPISTQSGFIFDENANKYKIIHICCSLRANDYYDYDYYPGIWIFTLGSQEWRRIKEFSESFNFMSEPSPVFLYDSLHFSGLISKDPNYSNHIGVMNVSAETFTKLEAPICIGNEDYGTLCVLGESLCLPIGYYGKIVLWTMEEYGVKESWKKQHIIDTTKMPEPLLSSSFKFLETRKNGVVLLIDGGNQGYYDLVKKEFCQIQNVGIPDFSGYSELNIVAHNGNLISPK